MNLIGYTSIETMRFVRITYLTSCSPVGGPVREDWRKKVGSSSKPDEHATVSNHVETPPEDVLVNERVDQERVECDICKTIDLSDQICLFQRIAVRFLGCRIPDFMRVLHE